MVESRVCRHFWEAQWQFAGGDLPEPVAFVEAMGARVANSGGPQLQNGRSEKLFICCLKTGHPCAKRPVGNKRFSPRPC